MAGPDDIRATARTARRSLSDASRHSADQAICAALLEVLKDRQPGALACYLSTDGEVDLSEATDGLRAQGWQLLLPVVGESSTMHFARWDAGDHLTPNRYRIAEPSSDSDPSVASELDVVVLPCVAVDRAGNRLGFGAGYYDRALSGADDVVRIGVAYEVQVVDRIDPQPWDVPLDVVITERNVVWSGEHR